MTIEERLKDYILAKYGTIKDFSDKSGIPYGTVMSNLKRGIMKSSASSILTMCETLQISADGLANGQILAVSEQTPVQYEDLLPYVRSVLASGTFSVDGIPVSSAEMDKVIEALEIATEMIRRKRK